MWKENHRKKSLLKVIIALSVVICGGIFFFTEKEEKDYVKSDAVFGNPLMGYAPCAWYESVGEDVNLLYMDITWAQLEPEEGQFAWESIEEKNHLQKWKAEGKHIVLRFVCDMPGNTMHMDIPQWLYEKTGGAGSWYDNVLGKGFAPDYANEDMIREHAKAVQALGEHFGRDGFISYIELGSLGHWGEWHVNYSAGIQRLPKENVREEYVRPWIDAFPDAMFLMRRSFSHASRYGMGLYNDMTGDASETESWLKEIENGGDLVQTEEKGGIASMPDYWKSAPSGGEFTSSQSMEIMLETNLNQTIDLIRQSHTTFLGPNIADAHYQQGYDAVLRNMGYRIWISHASFSRTLSGIKMQLTWNNDGVAPFYKEWKVWVIVKDNEGNLLAKKEISLHLSSLLPQQAMETETVLENVPFSSLEKYRVGIGVEDPMTDQMCVRFAMQTDYEDGINYLW